MTTSDKKDTDRPGMNAVVAELYSAWMSREQKLDEQKRTVRAAVTAFASGKGPDPTRLLVDLAEMREDCNSVCSSLVYAVRRAKEQQQQG